jgi:hypothetical protein
VVPGAEKNSDKGVFGEFQNVCYDYAGKDLVSAVMTTQAESMISRGLLRIVILGR